MRHTRFDARHVFSLLAVALILIAVVSTVVPFSLPAGAAPAGKIVLAWHAGLASRWLDPQEHDGTATPDNFFTALHDALIKNQGTQLYDHTALAEKFTVAADASAVHAAEGNPFHNGDPVTPQDVKFSYENYRGAKADVFKKKTERSRSSTTARSASSSRSRSSTSPSSSGPPTSPAPAGSCPRSTTSRSAPTASSRSPSGRVPTSSSATSRA